MEVFFDFHFLISSLTTFCLALYPFHCFEFILRLQQPQAEPVYYTTIAASPFGILPQILKDAATPKQPAEQPKSSTTSTTPAVSASKRRQAMLPHYKLTPRSEISGAVSRTNAAATPGGYDAEIAGRDMFVSKMGGVKKLTIESSDEGSALFNPNERARIRSGNSSVVNSISSASAPPSTPGGGNRDINFTMTSPSVVGTPSFPRPGQSAGDPAATYGGKFNGPTVAIMTSPAGAVSPSFGSHIASLSNANRDAPRLTTPGCYTIPSLSELQRKSSSELARLAEFTVGHSKFGTVSWTKSPTDVRNLNLDELVSFQQDSVEVYPETFFPHGSPADGVLNKVATVTIFNVSVALILARAGINVDSKRIAANGLSEREIDLVTAELRKLTTSFNGRFVSFAAEGNKWTFEVDHFTRYGLSGSNAVPTTTTTTTASHGANSANNSSVNSSTLDGKNDPLPTSLFASRKGSGVSSTSAGSNRRSSVSPSKLELHISDDEEDDDDSEPIQPLIPSSSSHDMDVEDDERSVSHSYAGSHGEYLSQLGDDVYSDYGARGSRTYSDDGGSYDEEYDEEDGEDEDYYDDDGTHSDFSQSDSVSSRAQSYARDPHHYGDRSALGDRSDGIESRKVATHFPSGRLANKLGLDDHHMATMKKHLFPSQTPKFESTRRPEISGFDSEPLSKRFKPNDHHVTEVKIRAPSYGMREGYGVAKKADIGPESARNKIPFSAPILPASASTSGECFTQVPLNNSVTKNASEVFVDARLRHGRSFRVAWAPNGTLYCPNFTTITHVRPFIAPSSVAPALIPSLEAHKRNASISHNKTHHILPSISLNDNWNQFVLHQISISYKHREDMRNSLLKFDSADLPSGMHQRFDSQVKNALEESYVKFATEHSTWKLVRTLFGEPQILNETLSAAPSYAHDHVESQLRKYALDKWLSEEVEEFVKRELLALGKEEYSVSRQWKVIFALLTGKKIDEAVKIALSLGENRLALLLAQILDPTELHSQVAAQLSTWTRERVLSPASCDTFKLEVLSLLAGQVRVVASKHKISEWLRSFAMHFWYGGANPFSTPLSTIVDNYAGIVESTVSGNDDEEKIHILPVLEGARAEISSKSIELDSTLSRTRTVTRFDVRYHLLKLFADNTLPLDELLHPNSSTKRFDYSLPWMLNSVLLARQVGMPALNGASVTTGYAQQLEACGLWNWAIYVLLALPASKSELLESLRNVAVRNIIMRNAEHIEKLMVAGEDGKGDFKLDENKVSSALLGLDVPHQWLYESVAQYYHYQKKYQEECFLRIKASQMEEAHTLLVSKWAPTVILQYGVDSSVWPSRFVHALNLLESSLEEEQEMENMDESENAVVLGSRNPLLESYKTHISSWNFGANLYVSYRRWFGAVKDAIIAWQTSAASLVDHELLAQLNRDASTFIALVNEWSSALNDVTKYLQMLESNGGSMSKIAWNQLPFINTEAGVSLRSRWEMNADDAKAEKIAASDLTSQLVNSVASLKLLIACIDADAPMPSRISAHLVPLQAYETLDSLDPLSQASLPSDQLSSNLSLLTSRYLDWRVTSL